MSDSEAVLRARWTQSEDLDREMGILRTLSSRSSLVEKSGFQSEFGLRREDRNDAVTGLGDDFVSPGNLFREVEVFSQQRPSSEGILERQGASRFSSAKFVSVGKLPLEEVSQRHPSEVSLGASYGRCDDRHQYFSMGERNGVEAGAGVHSPHRYFQPTSPVSEPFPRGGDVSVRRKSGSKM